MSGRYVAYPAYKPPMAKWQDDVPEGWRSLALGRMFRRVKRSGFSDEELLSVYRDFGVMPKESRDDNFNKASEDLSPYQLVRAGDLVMNKMKAWQGSIAMSEHRGIVSPAYFVYEAWRANDERMAPKYIHYLLRSPAYITQYLRRSKGIRVNQWDLDPGPFEKIEVLLPSLEEQTQIAKFLDYETANIDALIEKQQQLIALLKEKRQAVISHAVTKGLNPDAPMRDSSVEWIGAVPTHWSVLATGRVSDLTTGGRDTQDANPTGEYPFFVRSQTVEQIDTYSFEGEGVLTSGDGAGVGKIFHYYFGRLEFHQRVYLFHNFRRITGRFFFYFLREHLAIVALAGNAKSTVDSLRRPMLRAFPVCLPPVAEQEAITKFLDETVARIDALIAMQDGFRELLQERRTALISAAVTGKIDVRAWSPLDA